MLLQHVNNIDNCFNDTFWALMFVIHTAWKYIQRYINCTLPLLITAWKMFSPLSQVIITKALIGEILSNLVDLPYWKKKINHCWNCCSRGTCMLLLILSTSNFGTLVHRFGRRYKTFICKRKRKEKVNK